MNKIKIATIITSAIVLASLVFPAISGAQTVDCTNPLTPCSNGPIVPIPLGWFAFARGTNPVAHEFNCPAWYGPMGCMAPNGTRITN